jgi:hypothetical protein
METLLLGFLLVSNLVLLVLVAPLGPGVGEFPWLERDFFIRERLALIGDSFFLGLRNFGECC